MKTISLGYSDVFVIIYDLKHRESEEKYCNKEVKLEEGSDRTNLPSFPHPHAFYLPPITHLLMVGYRVSDHNDL